MHHIFWLPEPSFSCDILDVQDGNSQLSQGASIPVSREQRIRLCPEKVGIWGPWCDRLYSGCHVSPAWGMKKQKKAMKQVLQREPKAMERQGKGLRVRTWVLRNLAHMLQVMEDLRSVGERVVWEDGDPRLSSRRLPGKATLTETCSGSTRTSADVSWCVLRSPDENSGGIHNRIFGFQPGPQLCFSVVVKKKVFLKFSDTSNICS